MAEDQVSVDVAPLASAEGLARRVTVGGGGTTVTVTDCDALPPGPLHASKKVAFARRSPVDSEPLLAVSPVQPPDAVQVAAFVADQFSIELEPLAIVLGLAVKRTVGGEAELTVIVFDCAALPPGPVQVSV